MSEGIAVGKRVLVTGARNKWSISWHCGLSLLRAGAGWATVAATAVSGLIALHAGFPATVGFVALAVAAVLWSRERAPSIEAVRWPASTPP